MKSQHTFIDRRAVIGAIFISAIAMPVAFGQTADGVAPQQDQWSMRIRIVLHDQDFTATLYDNASAREFAAMLPLDLTISDFSDNEKIAYLPRKLRGLARGPFADAAPGDLCYYVPWGNLAFFYDGYESTRDLVRLGRLDGDVRPLLRRGEFPLRIERVE